MKKLSILCLILVLIVATCSLTVVALADEPTVQETTNPGVFKAGTTTLTAASDGIYYTNNSEFVFNHNSGSTTATKYYAAIIDKADVATVTGASVAADANKVENAIPTFTKENNNGTYIAFTTLTADGNYTKAKVVCYDSVAPVITNNLLTEWLESDQNDHDWYKFNVKADKDLQLPTDWIKDTAILTEDTALKDGANNSALLTVKVQYCNTSSYYWSSDKWDETDNDISVTSYGVWYFRYVVVDKAGNESIASADVCRYVAHSGNAPEIELTSTQLKVQTVGVKAGTTYTVPTPTVTSTGTNASYTYTINKLVDGQYVEIYNSETGEITEGYEDYVTTAGSIVSGKNEVATKGEDGAINYVYKVVYNAKDSYGYTSSLTLNVLTTQPDAEMTAFDVWETVLIVIAALSAVGIVVLLFVKPKETATEETGRKHYGDESKND